MGTLAMLINYEVMCVNICPLNRERAGFHTSFSFRPCIIKRVCPCTPRASGAYRFHFYFPQFERTSFDRGYKFRMCDVYTKFVVIQTLNRNRDHTMPYKFRKVCAIGAVLSLKKKRKLLDSL